MGASNNTKDLTPSKSASLRTTYIQQIKDLHNLMEIGAIDKEHFLSQGHAHFHKALNSNHKVLKS